MGPVPSAVERAVNDWTDAGKPAQPAIEWPRAAWIEAFPAQAGVFQQLPASLDRDSIGEFASRLDDDADAMVSLFLAAMAWGFGKVGYGPYRVRRMLDENPAIASHLGEARRTVQADGPLAGYRALAKAHRIKHLGPAFGTKFLFFASQPGARALILDEVVSTWLEHNCGVSRNPARWSEKTYAAYVADMEHWAAACDVEAHTLEMVIFTEQTAGSGRQWDARRDTEARQLVTRDGDPSEYDEELDVRVEDPDTIGDLEIPHGLVRQLLSDPTHAPEILASRAVEQFATRAVRDVRLLRDRNPTATDRQLAVYFKQKYSHLARWEGAGTGVAGILALPADLALLSWIQNRMVLSIAASYGHDMTDHTDRAAELLAIQGVHNSREVARKALNNWTQSTVTKLVVRHLRKDSLLLVKRLFGLVGIKFTRKAFVEKGIPLLAVPLSAGVNDLSTRLLANQALEFYDTEIT